METKLCKRCGNRFVPAKTWTQYCSNACRLDVKHEVDKYEIDVCSICNRPHKFLKKDKTRICSDNCKKDLVNIKIDDAIQRALGKQELKIIKNIIEKEQ